MKILKVILCFLVLSLGVVIGLISSAHGMGLTVDDLITDYNQKFGATPTNCNEVSRDFYNAISKTMQKANLKHIGIKEETRGGHAIITYTEGRKRHVITTWSDDNEEVYVKHIDYGNKSLHEVCVSLLPKYKFIQEHVKGYGMRVKSRHEVMREGGHRVREKYDLWGKDDPGYNRRRRRHGS